MTAYHLYDNGSRIGLKDAEALARLLLHNPALLGQNVRLEPCTVVRIPLEGKCNERDKPA